MVEMHFVDSRMIERIDGRKPHCRYSRSPKDTSSNFCHLHIVDIFFGEVHTDHNDQQQEYEIHNSYLSSDDLQLIKKSFVRSVSKG